MVTEVGTSTLCKNISFGSLTCEVGKRLFDWHKLLLLMSFSHLFLSLSLSLAFFSSLACSFYRFIVSAFGTNFVGNSCRLGLGQVTFGVVNFNLRKFCCVQFLLRPIIYFDDSKDPKLCYWPIHIPKIFAEKYFIKIDRTMSLTNT